MSPAVGGRDNSAMSVFAEELRHARMARGLSQDQLGDLINFRGSQIGMVEARRRVPSLDLARRCDEALGTTGTLERLHELLQMTPFAPWFRPYVELETEATELRSWQSIVVDGLLQTPDYARALLGTRVGASEDEVERQTAARLERQEILNRPEPPLLWVVMDEAVLRRPVGGPAAMLAQIEHLTEMAGRRNVVVQVVPMAAGAHDGVNGSFVIADFADAPGIVYLETALRGMILDRAEQVAAMRVSYRAPNRGAATSSVNRPDEGSSQDMDLTSAEWQKSSYSGNNGGQCVEVARNLPGVVAVRDSKNPAEAALLLTHGQWQSFLNKAREGKFDLS